MPTLCLETYETFRLATSNGLIPRLCQLLGHSDKGVQVEATQTIMSLARDGEPHLMSGLNFYLPQSAQLCSIKIVIEFGHLKETTEILASSPNVIQRLSFLLDSSHHAVVTKSLHALALLTGPEQGRVNARQADITNRLQELTGKNSEGKRWAAQVLRHINGQFFLQHNVSSYRRLFQRAASSTGTEWKKEPFHGS